MTVAAAEKSGKSVFDVDPLNPEDDRAYTWAILRGANPVARLRNDLAEAAPGTSMAAATGRAALLAIALVTASILLLCVFFGVFLVLPFTILWIFGAVIGHGFALAVSLLQLALLGFVLVVRIFRPVPRMKRSGPHMRRFVIAVLLSTCTCFWAYAMASPASPTGDDFGRVEPGYWSWAVFFYDEMTNLVLLDAPETLFGAFTSLEPQTALARAALLVLRLMGVFGLVLLAVNAYRNRFMRFEEFHGTKRELAEYLWTAGGRTSPGMKIALTGIVASVPADIANKRIVRAREFIHAIMPQQAKGKPKGKGRS